MPFLRSLSDKQILSKLNELVSRERSLTRGVLLHLNEIERRRLHLKLGYASMFDYCTTGLGYSSSAAARRIRTARCIARYPEVLALLKSNEVNLSTISQVSRILTPENKDRLLSRIRRKTQREVELVLAELEPRALPRERVTPIVVQLPTAVAPSSTAMKLSPPATMVPGDESKSGAYNALQSDHCRSGSESTAIEKRMHLSFSVSDEFMAKLEKIRSLAWHKLPANASMEQVFTFVMDYVIEKEDPRKRNERRMARQNQPSAIAKARSKRTRHVAAAMRDSVLQRDEGRCTYVGDSGKRCDSTQAIQIDHIEPFARGGKSSADNLRVLCAYHNRLEAERLMGMRHSKSTGNCMRNPERCMDELQQPL